MKMPRGIALSGGALTNTTLDYTATGYAWEDKGIVIDNTTGAGSGVKVTDPDLFIDDDGSWWLSPR